jgi:hypothetical protein
MDRLEREVEKQWQFGGGGRVLGNNVDGFVAEEFARV